jgi:hypothetical protein
VSRRPGAGALAGIAMILFLAAPAAAARVPGAPRSVFDVLKPAVPLRDVVLKRPSASASRISATASAASYPIGDGDGSTVMVSVTSACQAACTAADPLEVAAFLGTLIHGPEIDSVTVQMDTPDQLAIDCGFGSQACYYSGENQIVISGDPAPGPDGATRDFVLAHEYGHHVAQHRRMPAPFPAAIDWGTERWSSYEHVCQGRRRGAYFPGDEGSRYPDDPGEAFAESFAFNRFPDASLRWEYADSLRPSARAFAMVRHDVLSPWRRRRTLDFKGRLPSAGHGTAVRTFRTPLDGKVSLRLAGAGASRFEVLLRSHAGRRLRSSQDVAAGREVSFTTCGQARLQAAVRRLGPTGGRFRLIVKEP